MTKDEVMALANETAGQHWMDEAHVQRFAAAVAAVEREACAQVCDAAEKRRWEAMAHGGRLAGVSPADCAATIRARGD